MTREGVATAAATAASGIWPVLGINVPVIPAIVGMLAALLVRVMVITRAKPGLYVFNISLTVLAMMAALVTTIDHRLTVGGAFWAGIGCGALGVGLVEIGKSSIGAALRSAAQAGLRALAPTTRGGDQP